ncbi:MAG: methylmalonyl-CoA mutase family protein, partial [Bacteroidota bacterium]
HPVRFVTAASLFDGHDAAINIMRRILQARGAEVIHLGHNRSALDVVQTAIEEDAHGIAVSSYQGGHNEYFRYMIDLLRERGAGHIQVFGGGGGVIVPEEIEALEAYGVAKIFSPEDGLRMGLEGMIDYMIDQCDHPLAEQDVSAEAPAALRLARNLTRTESNLVPASAGEATFAASEPTDRPPVLGITGTGGAGKSTLTDELVRRFLNDFDDIELAVLSVDPTRRRTGGALLGDRIRMNALYGAGTDRVYMRSFATRQAHRATTQALREAIQVCQAAGFDLVIVETAGIGQSDSEIEELADVTLYVMTAEFGAPSQLEKIGMLDVADYVALNKFEKPGGRDALRDVRKQVQRNRGLFDQPTDAMPVYPTMAARFNDPGVTNLYLGLLGRLNGAFAFNRPSNVFETTPGVDPDAHALIAPERQRYLADIAQSVRSYHSDADAQVDVARKWGHAVGALEQVEAWDPDDRDLLASRLEAMRDHWWSKLSPKSRDILSNWDDLAEAYRQETFTYQVRKRDITVPLFTESLSGLRIPRVALPRTQDAGERLRFAYRENLPGYFPYTAGVFPFKRAGEDPTRMFAGEGGPERTNKRFHLVSEGMPAKRLSTAFDSVTLYGFDPHERPDIYGKVGNAGVSICTLDDMKKLYSGFDLCDRATSVSMTINGPAPMILAFFMNTAIDQQVEFFLKREGRWDEARANIERRLGPDRPRYTPYDGGGDGAPAALPVGHDGSGLGLLGTTGSELVEWGLLTSDEFATIKADTLKRVRGTVQADILKEDQAQNTCIFSTEFALRMMGDVQASFIDHGVRNYYSVSISGYHIAEAGANPITQLAFTLSNGFTLVEYYLSRGMHIDDFAANLSFFFSNGLDPEYSVIGRVARRIWAVSMRDRYGANDRSQKLKYHIQTSGRSLHAQEIQFNDIRTTLQALLAVYDNCNSLHTNAYDEAITTPTEESVRRAMAIQLIINREFGPAKNENPLQGAFITDELTDLVEEAVLLEFERLNRRGGVLGAMETMYQRGKIQEESMLYEQKKHSGELPIIGVNTFKAETEDEAANAPVELMRSTDEEKRRQIHNLRRFQSHRAGEAPTALRQLQDAARSGGNLFDELLETVKSCSLGQITHALFEVGGEYRRNT